MRSRLREDHDNAAALAKLLAEIGVDVEEVPHRTNMVYFNLGDDLCSASELAAACSRRGLLIGSAGERRVRMVTHVGLDDASVKNAVLIIKEVLSL
jgi:threonine aldolase